MSATWCSVTSSLKFSFALQCLHVDFRLFADKILWQNFLSLKITQMAQIQEQPSASSSSTTQATSTSTPVVGDAFQSLWDESKYLLII